MFLGWGDHSVHHSFLQWHPSSPGDVTLQTTYPSACPPIPGDWLSQVGQAILHVFSHSGGSLAPGSLRFHEVMEDAGLGTCSGCQLLCKPDMRPAAMTLQGQHFLEAMGQRHGSHPGPTPCPSRLECSDLVSCPRNLDPGYGASGMYSCGSPGSSQG